MPNAPLPTWMLWIGAVSTIAVAWAGFALSIRNYLDQHPKIKFLFRASQGIYADQEYRESLHWVLDVTLTNSGGGTISLDHLTCKYLWAEKSVGTDSTDLKGRTLTHGQALNASLAIPQKPTAIDLVILTDSTGQEWKLTRRERKQLALAVREWT